MENSPIVNSALLPKKAANLIEKSLGYLPDYLIVLPQVAFKRPYGRCIALRKDGKCSIYECRPPQCRYFPFVSESMAQKQDFSTLYPFCKALQGPKVKGKAIGKAYRERNKRYFENVLQNGFKKVWSVWPNGAILSIGKQCYAERISKRDFFIIEGLASRKSIQ